MLRNRFGAAGKEQKQRRAWSLFQQRQSGCGSSSRLKGARATRCCDRRERLRCLRLFLLRPKANPKNFPCVHSNSQTSNNSISGQNRNHSKENAGEKSYAERISAAASKPSPPSLNPAFLNASWMVATVARISGVSMIPMFPTRKILPLNLS